MLNLSKDADVDMYNKGVKSALGKADFMKNYDIVTVQALALYLASLRSLRCILYPRSDQWSRPLFKAAAIRMKSGF